MSPIPRIASIVPLLCSCAALAPRDPGASAPAELLLVPGDVVRVVGLADEAVELEVGPGGTLSLPGLAPFAAEGRNVSAVERYARITGHAGARAELARPGPAVAVAGEVEEPGRRPVAERTTILQAVMDAGPTSGADLRQVRLFRGEGAERIAIRVDLKRVLERGDATANVLVLPGDRIIVPPGLVGALF